MYLDFSALNSVLEKYKRTDILLVELKYCPYEKGSINKLGALAPEDDEVQEI